MLLLLWPPPAQAGEGIAEYELLRWYIPEEF